MLQGHDKNNTSTAVKNMPCKKRGGERFGLKVEVGLGARGGKVRSGVFHASQGLGEVVEKGLSWIKVRRKG